MARGKIALKVIEVCPFCCLELHRALSVPYRTKKLRCRQCHHSVKEMLTHKFSEVEMQQIKKVTIKDIIKYPKFLDHRDYKFPLESHLKDVDRKQLYVFLAHLQNIITDETEFLKFREFTRKDKQRREQ